MKFLNWNFISGLPLFSWFFFSYFGCCYYWVLIAMCPVHFIVVTTVDSGSKALKFLGLHEDDQRNPEIPSVCPNSHHQVPYGFYFHLFLFFCLSQCLRFQPFSLLFFPSFSLVSEKCLWFFVVLQEVEVNLIITDYCMPGMTGYDLLKKIKVWFVFLFLCLFALSSLYSLPFSQSFHIEIMFLPWNS